MKKESPIIKWTLPVTLSMTIICFAILFSFHFRGLYYWDIKYLSISQQAHIEADEIKQNYDILIDYLTNEKIEKLLFPSFGMSKEGEIHFQDVKNIIMFIKKAMYTLGILSGLGIFINIAKKQYEFLKHTAVGIITVPLGLLLVAMIDFDKSFIIFHELAFSNSYWIFDPVKDPVIMILPQTFFIHSFLLIISMIVTVAITLLILYKIITN